MSQPVYDRHGVQVHVGDCLDVLRQLPDASVHAIVTDPPAGIRFMNRAWDSDMGGRHSWVAWLSERMQEAHRVLKPGGYGLVWALPRTSHWTAWALEDAGFEVRDCVVHLFGNGFPKSLDVSKAIDKLNGRDLDKRFAMARHIRERREAAGLTRAAVAARFPQYREVTANWERTDEHGNRVPTVADWAVLAPWLGLSDEWLPLVERVEAEREVIGQRTTGLGTGRGSIAYIADSDNRDVTAPATAAARMWEGWGTALKPAAEHWWLIRKPLVGTVAANVQEHDTGALNIAALRGEGGRWPTNIVLTHAARCDDEGCDPSWCPVAELDGQSGTLKSGSRKAGEHGLMGYMGAGDAPMPAVVGDSGGASRFFPTFRWEAKAPTSERPMVGGKSHETVKPIALMRWMVRLVCVPGGTVLDCFAGSGTTGQAARAEGMRAVLIEADPDHIDKIRARLDARPKTTAAAVAPGDEPMDLLDLLDGGAA